GIVAVPQLNVIVPPPLPVTAARTLSNPASLQLPGPTTPLAAKAPGAASANAADRANPRLVKPGIVYMDLLPGAGKPSISAGHMVLLRNSVSASATSGSPFLVLRAIPQPILIRQRFADKG